MSLRSSYGGALDAKLVQAREAGRAFVLVTYLADITTDMEAAANQGKRSFILNYGVTFQPLDLRLLGPLWDAFKSGVTEALISEDIMLSEFDVKLNDSDTVSTSVDIVFKM